MKVEPRVKLAELLQEVLEIELSSKRLVRGILAGGYHSVFRGTGIEFDEVREYVEGDDPRSVDWNVSARMGRPFVKKYVDERELCVFFLFDLSLSMNAGGGAWSARQAAARLTALLALSAIQNHDRVGLIAFAGGIERVLPPRKGVAHALRLVREALALESSTPGTNVAAPLRWCARALRRRAIVFLLSDFASPLPSKELSLCARRHDLIAVRLHSPETTSAPPALLRLRDPESGLRQLLDLRETSARETYVRLLAEKRHAITAELTRAGVDRIEVFLPRSAERAALVRPILEFFRRRDLARTRA